MRCATAVTRPQPILRTSAVQRRCRGPQRVYATVESDDAQVQSTDKRSAAVLSLFERAATPLGQVERAQAALAVANALVDRPELNRKPARKVAVAVPTEPASLGLKKLRRRKAPAEESSAPAAAAAAPPPAAPPPAIVPPPTSTPAATTPGSMGGLPGSPGAGLEGPVGGDAGGDRSSSPGPDFWSWVPPERQKAKKTQVAAPTMLMERSSKVLPPLQSVTEGLSKLKFESDLEAPDLVGTPAENTPEIVFRNQVAPTEAEVALREMQEMEVMAAVDAGASQGDVEAQTSNGSRVWQETGQDELEGGRLCRWTVVRGQSADGTTEWEEKFWETSDAWGYRELGAEKSGRDSKGNVWNERWMECMEQQSDTGLSSVQRTATKWGKTGENAQWCETWNEDYGSDGRTDKTAYKWATLADGEIPEVNHGNNWHEKWGESWDGKGGATKWTDRWAERYADGTQGNRKWGEKWNQRFGYEGGGSEGGGKSGEEWTQHENEEPYSRTWGEVTIGEGNVRKFGQSTSGEHWDVVHHEDSWYEKYPHYGFDEAVRHSNELLMVPLRRRDGRGLRKRGITISLDELPERGATDDRSGRGGLRAIVPTMGEDEEADVGGGDGGNNQPPDQPPADLGAGL